jgi:feruloyl-CoA synthase
MVFADDAGRFGPALDALAGAPAAQVVAHGDRDGALAFDALARTIPGDDAERAFSRLGPDTVVKILFTSGSTGAPKGVVNTHRMICSNQQALGQVWPFMRQEPPVLADWLPWSHTFGANHNLHQAIAFGGTLYIDDGKPAPELFEQTVQALREVRPTVYYNVPAGYALLTPRLEADRDLAEAFFSRLRFMFYAAAALPEALWDRLRRVADEVADHQVPLTASWGTTETAPAATTAHFAAARCGCIGVPLPGVTLKLVPDGAKWEIRVTGPNVTPGYHRDPTATAAAFDEEGFYRTGDAGRLVAEEDPDQGLMFDGRLAEDFKLMSGTWVMVGGLRVALLSAAGVLRDAVIAGHDRAAVAAVAWVDQGEARRVCGAQGDVALGDPALRAHLAACLARLNEGSGSAARIERLLLLDEPPDLDAGEITDKGYVNQRAVLERRAAQVARLFGEPLDEAVITAA